MMGKKEEKKEKRRLKALKKLEVADRSVDNTRGSVLWAYNHYRTRMMTSLLNDLIDLENQGLEEQYCDHVQKSLEYFVNATTEVPKGGFLTGSLYPEVTAFAKTYEKWNRIEGEGEDKVRQRRKYLVKLRGRRQRITNRVRSIQFELHNGLDKKVLADTYTAIGRLINLAPDLFANLASSYSDYLKRGGFVAA